MTRIPERCGAGTASNRVLDRAISATDEQGHRDRRYRGPGPGKLATVRPMHREPATRIEVERLRNELRHVERRVAQLEHEERMRAAQMPAWFWVMLATSIVLSVLTVALDAGR